MKVIQKANQVKGSQIRRQFVPLRYGQQNQDEDLERYISMSGHHFTFPMFLDTLVKLAKFLQVQKQVNQTNKGTMYLKTDRIEMINPDILGNFEKKSDSLLLFELLERMELSQALLRM